MNQEQVKEKLLELNSDVADFTVILSGKKSKKVDGLYHPDSKEIIIHNKNHENDNQLLYTAIHEFAHHVHFSSSPVPISTRAHTIEFWNIFHTLLYNAEELGIYNNIFTTNGEFLTLTRRIKHDFLTQNGKLMKEFGHYLLEARELCEKYKASFSDYLDRILKLPRGNARSLIKVHTLNVNPEVGFENMKTIASIPDQQERVEAEKELLSGHSPDMVKTKYKSKHRENEPLEILEKEKKQIKKRIINLTAKLEVIEKRIDLLANKE